MAVKYAIEYKSASYPYSYKFLKDANSKIKVYDRITDARKKGIALIKMYEAIVCVIRGNDREGLVYATRTGGYVYEDRNGNKSKWYHLNRNGTLGSAIPKVNGSNLIRSAFE